MKTDLATSIVAAIVGVLAAFFICNIFLPKTKDYTITVLDSNTNYSISEPDVEVFNFRSINPTVEVYVGQCESGNCDENIIIDVPESEPEETPTPEENNPNPENNSENEETTPDTNKEGENGTTN